jgi:hypothetical protein
MNAPETPHRSPPPWPMCRALPTRGGSPSTRWESRPCGIRCKVLDKSGGVQHTIAIFNMYVGLPHNFKGTHMSRFVEILNSHEREISVENFPAMLREMVEPTGG